MLLWERGLCVANFMLTACLHFVSLKLLPKRLYFTFVSSALLEDL
jgi:hypothetical protein